jgi:quercetin dioxygenase-like cupin family protein
MGSALLSFDNSLSTSQRHRTVHYQGGIFHFPVDSHDTAGQFAVMDVKASSPGGPPLHVHRNEDEFFYVIAGELRVLRGSEEMTLLPGESVFLPRNVPHTFRIVSNHAHILNYITPGGFEDYFRELGHPISDGCGTGQCRPITVPEMIRVAGTYGVTFLP